MRHDGREGREYRHYCGKRVPREGLALAATLGPDFHSASVGAIRAAMTAMLRRQGTAPQERKFRDVPLMARP